MKKPIFSIMVSLMALMVLSLFPQPSAASLDSSVRSEFTQALEKQLQDSVNYYYSNSAIIKDSFELTSGSVMKIVNTDNPNTPEDEEVVEEYTSHIAVALVEYKQQRDTFFFFKKKEVFYYDVDKNEFLTSSNVFLNDEISEFFLSYLDELNKQITPISTFIIIVMLSLIIIVPVLIMIFHNPGRNSYINVYASQRDIRG